MGFWDGIAALGLAGRGYAGADALIRDRESDERRKKREDLMLKEALRKDDLAEGLRAATAAVRPRAATKGLDTTSPIENDPYGEGYVRTEPGIASPESPDIAGANAAAESYLRGRGEIDQAERYRKALKDMEDEGYKDVVIGVASGQPIKEIAAKFNQIGSKRIVGGTSDGKTYKITYEDGTQAEYNRDDMLETGARMGWLKKPETRILPQGSTLVREGDGKLLATGAPKTTRIDPLSPEGIEARERVRKGAMADALANRKDFEAWKRDFGAGKTPAKIAEIKSLVSEFGMDPDQALAMAYGINRNTKSLEERIQKWAGIVAKDPGLDSEQIVARATQLASTFGDTGGRPAPARSGAAKAGGEGPEQLSGPGSGYEPPAAGKYASAVDVREAFRLGKISRDEAKKQLRSFGYK